ncbi:type II toxin-antitoxin system RelB/DinJ family antitoxin [Candidatus Berkelbacteria bacterium]|nr:type II toxin-antitoxin system RelB/DinJ family antitoxin [Candidatus Berkelbacteria bacterium]
MKTTKKVPPAVITIKADRRIKERAAEIAAASGLTLSHVLNAALRRYIRDESIAFLPVYELRPEIEAELAEDEKDAKAGRNLGTAVTTEKELDAYFDRLEKLSRR